jgi:hypothetical protein
MLHSSPSSAPVYRETRLTFASIGRAHAGQVNVCDERYVTVAVAVHLEVGALTPPTVGI